MSSQISFTMKLEFHRARFWDQCCSPFILTPLYEFLNATGVIYHFYADDSQFIFELDYNFTSISFILKQIIDVMCELKLVNNSSKTDLIVFFSIAILIFRLLTPLLYWGLSYH